MSGDGPGAPPPLDAAAAVFLPLRQRLFGIAYRMLGSAAEAEDVVQEAWIRWQGTDRQVVRDPAAFLATTTTRLAINAAQSARSRRETYVGPWLPEPIDTNADPRLGAERDEALQLAVLLLLERLPPLERAAYVLREAFDYSYAQIADILQVTEANARQLGSRARKHLAAERHAEVGADAQRRLLTAFLAAAQKGDVGALEQLFTRDVVSLSDGGGAVHAARKPIAGRARVVQFIVSVSRWLWAEVAITWVEANGRAGLLLERDDAPYALLTVDVAAARIAKIFWVMHPAKLARIAGAERSASADRRAPS